MPRNYAEMSLIREDTLPAVSERDRPQLNLADVGPTPVWSEQDWKELAESVRRAALRAGEDAVAWNLICRAARRVMATYTTSFFIASRFLPKPKRRMVEVIYAAVRYPDEIVDTLPLSQPERHHRLATWRAEYEAALGGNGILDALRQGISPFVAGFVEVVRRTDIPADAYRVFLDAMQYDVEFELFESLEDLIERYVAGSAIAVGVFLTHVYGAQSPEAFPMALESARHLAIGLQLTNFARDVPEDARRGRWYLPMDMMRRHGAVPFDLASPANRRAIRAVVHELADYAEEHYRASERGLNAFSAETQLAIRACLELYRRLNRRVQELPDCLAQRASVSWREKWALLPPSKYIRVPLMWWL